MFAAFATRSGPRDYDDLVRDLWACAGREVSPREAEEFERRMEAFPEADCDDSYLLDYYAMSVMGTPFETLHVLAGGGVKRAWPARSPHWRFWASSGRSSMTRTSCGTPSARSSCASSQASKPAGTRPSTPAWPRPPPADSPRSCPQSSRHSARSRTSTWHPSTVGNRRDCAQCRRGIQRTLHKDPNARFPASDGKWNGAHESIITTIARIQARDQH